ncbi:MAG: FAD-dependent oxidoreductase [Pseudomonadota bacterium]|nr:FAD-dependent oxidoreductase [Pseudomonadota bacterium]
MSVAIIGGGWAGIACAVELADAGRPVTLYEAAKQLGGRGRGVDWNGIRIDNGQHLMIGAYGETLRLLHRLGTAHLLERRPLRLQVPGFRLALPRLPAPLHLATGLLLARGLSLAEKWAAARFMQALQAIHYRLPEDLPAATLLHRHRQPPALIAKLWAPICIAALNTPVEAASAQVFCNVLRDSLAGSRADSDLLMNRADLGSLAGDAALAQLGPRVSLGEKVTGIAARPPRMLKPGALVAPASMPAGLSDAGKDAGATVETRACFTLTGPEQSAEQVVLAVHPSRLPALLADLPEMADISNAVAGFTWQPILTLWLRFATPPVFPFPMLGLGDGHAPWAFERRDLAPGLVAIVMSADGPHIGQPAEQLRDEYLDLLAQALGPLPALLDWKTITEKRATWSCIPNLPRPDNTTPVPGLYLAGDYTAGDYPATLEGAVASGVKCARLILQT